MAAAATGWVEIISRGSGESILTFSKKYCRRGKKEVNSLIFPGAVYVLREAVTLSSEQS
jgi:hypothetical protein